MSDAPTYVLHVWPAKWGLQSLDPACLAAVMYLQLTIPGKFKVAYTTNPDTSPNGQLPFLTHGHATVSTFPSIVAFVTSLAKSHASGAVDLDASLSGLQKAHKTALFAHIETCISDLVSYMFYGNHTNFWGLTNPTLASEMPIPQKYYVANRIREVWRPRLEAAGLWSLPSEGESKSFFDREKEKKQRQDHTVTFSRAFEREKILDKARTALSVHASHLHSNGKHFLFEDSPTSLDVYLAAHILLLADPPFPDAVLQIQLTEYYQELIDLARRIQVEVARAPPYEVVTGSQSALNLLIPRLLSGNRSQTQADPEDVRHNLKSLMLVGAALAATAAYIYAYGVIVVSTVQKGSEDEGSDIEDEEEGLENGSESFANEEED